MSIQALITAYKLRGLSMAEASLIHTLAWHHNKDTGQCNPGADTLRKETGMSNDTLWKTIRSLEAKKLLSHVSGGIGRPNRYQLLLDGVVREGGPSEAKAATPDDDKPTELTFEIEADDDTFDDLDDDILSDEPAVDTSSAQRLCQKIYWGANKRTVIPTKKDAEMIADKLRERPAGEVESVVDFITGHLGFKKSLLVYKGVPIKYPVSFFCSTMYDSYLKITNNALAKQK
jgi:hypothetical protein